MSVITISSPQRLDGLANFERFGPAVELYALLTRTRFSSTRIHMDSRPHAGLRLGTRVGVTTTCRWWRAKPSDQSLRSTKRNRPLTSLVLNPAISTFARATGKVAGKAMRRTLTLVLMFFDAIIEPRAMMERRQAIASAAGAAPNQKRHDTENRRRVIAVVASHTSHATLSHDVHRRPAGAGNPHFLLLKPALPSKWRAARGCDYPLTDGSGS
jgi:hypothetical protein